MKTGEIASKLDGKLTGDQEVEIGAIASIDKVSDGDLVFATGDVSQDWLDSAPMAACILVPRESTQEFKCPAIRVTNPKSAFARIAEELTVTALPQGISQNAQIAEGANVQSAFIGENVSIGKNTTIGRETFLFDGVRIGENAIIGRGTVIYPNVVIYDGCEIGDDCVLHAGAVIGAEGFGYVRDKDEIIKFPQVGKTVIENNVEIGANTCIDRGALGETRIGAHTKIDNLVQVAHNVSIGKRVLIASQVGISGSVVIEDDVVIGGQVGIADHVTIKKGAILGARSAVFPGKIVRAGMWAGSPVQPIKKYKEQNALIRSLSRLKIEIKEIRNKLN